MATYIIGDLQGCFEPLQRLLTQINYNPQYDQLWFVGDIINRGPQSLECLRFVKSLGDGGKMVLGNHDIHLLACYSGLTRYLSKKDTLQPILDAEDVDELIDWLRHQPLLVEHSHLEAIMVHAGIPPQWSIAQAKGYAKEIEAQLQSDSWQSFVRDHLFGAKGQHWHDQLTGWERLRYIVNAFVRMRYCDAQGTLDFSMKGAPKHPTSDSMQPWFVHNQRRNKDYEIFFGHWSTLGAIDAYRVHATDTGCLWGGRLTGYCLETRQRHEVPCQTFCRPKKVKTNKNSKKDLTNKPKSSKTPAL